MLKPSELAPATRECTGRVGPQYLDARGRRRRRRRAETTALLAERFDHIFYTGNGTVGRIVMRPPPST